MFGVDGIAEGAAEGEERDERKLKTKGMGHAARYGIREPPRFKIISLHLSLWLAAHIDHHRPHINHVIYPSKYLLTHSTTTLLIVDPRCIYSPSYSHLIHKPNHRHST